MDREQAIHAFIQYVISISDGAMDKEQADRLALTINTAAQANLLRVVECPEEPFIGLYGILEV
jgi:hypothetical protein